MPTDLKRGDVFEFTKITDEVDKWHMTRPNRSLLIIGRRYMVLDIVHGQSEYDAYGWIHYTEVPDGIEHLVVHKRMRKASIECVDGFGGTSPKGVEIKVVGTMHRTRGPVIWKLRKDQS